jgi:hypothetical protein
MGSLDSSTRVVRKMAQKVALQILQSDWKLRHVRTDMSVLSRCIFWSCSMPMVAGRAPLIERGQPQLQAQDFPVAFAERRIRETLRRPPYEDRRGALEPIHVPVMFNANGRSVRQSLREDNTSHRGRNFPAPMCKTR